MPSWVIELCAVLGVVQYVEIRVAHAGARDGVLDDVG